MSRSSGAVSRKKSCERRTSCSAWARSARPRRALPVDEAEHAAFIERLRRSGISVDREGRFIHEGAEVTHEGLKRALFRWLDRLPAPDGRYVLRLDARRFAYLEDVADTPLVARAARVDADGGVRLALSDGSEEPLDPTT